MSPNSVRVALPRPVGTVTSEKLGRMSCTKGRRENFGTRGTMIRAITRLVCASVPKFAGLYASWKKIWGREVRGSENSSASFAARWLRTSLSSAVARTANKDAARASATMDCDRHPSRPRRACASRSRHARATTTVEVAAFVTQVEGGIRRPRPGGPRAPEAQRAAHGRPMSGSRGTSCQAPDGRGASLHVDFHVHPGVDAALEEMLALRKAAD